MSSIINDHQVFNKLLEYESIFKYYDIGIQSQDTDRENERSIEMKRDNKNLFETKRLVLERNENNKKKKINAKTINKKSKQSKKPEKKSKTKDHDKIIKITVPNAAKVRQASHTDSQHQEQQSNKNPKVTSPIPVISLHVPSSSTIKTVQKLPTFEFKTDQSISNIQSSTNRLIPPILSTNETAITESNPITNSQINKKNLTLTNKSPDHSESIWDLDEINRFTREIFKHSSGDHTKSIIRSHRIRLKCAIDQDDYLKKYIQSRFHCLNIFEEYIITLKRQHGMVLNAASDPPLFDPGISITGPQIKKDASTIDKEDSRIIKKMNGIEPRKKYALVHEQIGIFIIGGYNLLVDIPIQKEPKTDYLFKFDGDIVKIPPLHPCRVHFAIYTDGDAIYIAGGQTIHNELLDDIQCLNIKTLKWEHVTTLINPIAACGMTLDNKRIYLAGGYDILQNHTIFLADYTIYNLSTRQFEKSTDLPSPRCRSLVFATDHAIFCISGLIETFNENNNKKLKISTDILKWTQEMSQWIKVSQTPELTKFHALSFNDPYLEITKRILNNKGDEIDTIAEAYYDFRTNVWTNGKAPTSPISTLPVKSTATSHTPKSPSKSKAKSSPKTPNKKKTIMAKSPSKNKSPPKTKDKKQELKKKTKSKKHKK